MKNEINFELWFKTLSEGIATYEYYVDFEQIERDRIESSNPYLPEKWNYIKAGLA